MSDRRISISIDEDLIAAILASLDRVIGRDESEGRIVGTRPLIWLRGKILSEDSHE